MEKKWNSIMEKIYEIVLIISWERKYWDWNSKESQIIIIVGINKSISSLVFYPQSKYYSLDHWKPLPKDFVKLDFYDYLWRGF